MLNSSQAICQFYKSSRGCKFGTSCRFLHSIPPDISDNSQNKDGILNRESESPSTQATTTILETVDYTTKQDESVNKAKDQKKLPKNTNLKVCFYFEKYGNCKFGTKCRFAHTEDPCVKSVEKKTGDGAAAGDSEKQQTTILNDQTKGKSRKRPKRICHFYKNGFCKKGEDCKFRHVDTNSDVEEVKSDEESAETNNGQDVQSSISSLQVQSDEATVQSKGKVNHFPKRQLHIPSGNVVKELKRDSASFEEIYKLRTTELQQLRKRFPKEKLNEFEKVDENDEEDMFQLSFSSSDPDWPYDVKIFELQIVFPKEYPLQPMKICLPLDQNLPETVRRYVEVTIQEWIEEKETQNSKRNIITMEFRPFIRWLDRNLEAMVTEGLKQLQRELMAKAAGLEFIPASQLKKEIVSSPTDGGTSNTGSDDDDQEDREFIVYKKEENEEIYTGPTEDGSEYSSDEEETSEDKNVKQEMDFTETVARGTEVRLRNVQLRESASTMVFHQIKLVIQCSRCHNRLDVKTPPGQVNAVACQKCNQSQLVSFRPTMVHQFSSVIGYLDLEGCTAFDLVLQDCNFKLGCLLCSKETWVQGLPPGQLKDVSCHTCHKKMRCAADSTRFYELQPSSVDESMAVNVPVMRIKKIPKDPRIMLGSPLPDDGTCKHYKKSFRWFRFPCCGKCYPCDVCHNDKEDHEMTQANRMICGHCCKEQPFAMEKPCVACHQLMTKSRSAFWEGGKGCRDKTKMSRDDARKYTNTNKTVSRKAQEKLKPNKKKENK